jgi:hypothetical protein
MNNDVTSSVNLDISFIECTHILNMMFRRMRGAVAPLASYPTHLKEASWIVADKAMSQIHTGSNPEASHLGEQEGFATSRARPPPALQQMLPPVCVAEYSHLTGAVPPSTLPPNVTSNQHVLTGSNTRQHWQQEEVGQQPAQASQYERSILVPESQGITPEDQPQVMYQQQQAVPNGFGLAYQHCPVLSSTTMVQGNQWQVQGGLKQLTGITPRETLLADGTGRNNAHPWQGVDPNLLVQRLLASGHADAVTTVMQAAGMDIPAPRKRLAPVVGYPTVHIYPIS